MALGTAKDRCLSRSSRDGKISVGNGPFAGRLVGDDRELDVSPSTVTGTIERSCAVAGVRRREVERGERGLFAATIPAKGRARIG